jgi:hypothetical protein
MCYVLVVFVDAERLVQECRDVSDALIVVRAGFGEEGGGTTLDTNSNANGHTLSRPTRCVEDQQGNQELQDRTRPHCAH